MAGDAIFVTLGSSRFRIDARTPTARRFWYSDLRGKRVSREGAVQRLMQEWRRARLAGDLRDDAAFRKMGLNRTDGRALDALAEGPRSGTELANMCGVSLNAMTTVVDRLIERGFVERTRDEADRRRVTIQRTAFADAVSDEIFGPIREWTRENLSHYSADELDLLTAYTRHSREVQQRHLAYIEQLDAAAISAAARDAALPEE